MTNIAVVGVSFVDIKGFSFGPYSPRGTNIGSVTMSHGGVSRNVAEDLARIGANVSFISMSEESGIGREVTEHLRREGIHLDNCVSVSERGIGMWLALLDEQGDLAGSVSAQPNFLPLEEMIREKGETLFNGIDHIVLEIDLNEKIAESVLEIAERQGKNVYVIVGNMSVIRRHPEYLSKVRCLICNEIEAGLLFNEDLRNMTKDSVLRLVRERAPELRIPMMVVTLGEKGAVYADFQNALFGTCETEATDIVDTTGAGDAFFSGAVYALIHGRRISEAVRIGSRLASMTIACEESSCPPCVTLL